MPTILRCKCVIVGDAAAGKSSIAQVFHSDGSHFPKNYAMTQGVEVLVKPVNIPETSDSVEMYLYDSAGKEIFSDLVRRFWDHPAVVMVVYDCTSETSFSSCKKWLERIRSQCPDIQVPGALVANKTDLDQRRVISPKVGKELALSNKLEYFECSAKEMQNVDTPFFYLANEFHKLYQERVELFDSLT
ncbi:intraflagellar transport protein 27 homolog [Plakobranchus ocellatus]|uniref:Intraflagellar transport protein 27 homolog n=1 Tax=Plakobranchus ocellatus TaxID=259542 RepID=A0AAV4CBC4_9GAST|nr:intraflagellar transport protein 27 homolog [Plakobranchus ocellatus]